MASKSADGIGSGLIKVEGLRPAEISLYFVAFLPLLMIIKSQRTNTAFYRNYAVACEKVSIAGSRSEYIYRAVV